MSILDPADVLILFPEVIADWAADWAPDPERFLALAEAHEPTPADAARVLGKQYRYQS